MRASATEAPFGTSGSSQRQMTRARPWVRRCGYLNITTVSGGAAVTVTAGYTDENNVVHVVALTPIYGRLSAVNPVGFSSFAIWSPLASPLIYVNFVTSGGPIVYDCGMQLFWD